MALTSINKSVVVAFNIVHSLAQGKEHQCLTLWFAYVHLNHTINALDTLAEADYTNIYLNTKRNSLDILSS
jgi:hypothetical protein